MVPRLATLALGTLATIALSLPSRAADPARAQPPWRIGMSSAFSGPAQALGTGMRDGVLAYFATVNARGGVHGRLLELVARDDAYEPARTAPNVRALIDDAHVFALLGNVGSPTAAVSLPIVEDKRLPFFGAYSGADLLRKTPPDRYVVNFRASYAEEMAEMVRGLVVELGIRPEQIGFFTQNDAYGDAAWRGAVAALEGLGYAAAADLPHGRYPRNTLDVEDALSELLDPRADVRAVIMVGVYGPCARFIKLAKAHDFDPYFLNVSFVGSEALADALGEEGEGVVVTQVVPPPDGDTAAARGLQAAVPAAELDFVTFEGFLAAKAFVIGLERAGADATPDSFIDALESGAPLDLGLGVEHRLSKTEHQLSHRVWPTVIRGGRFVSLARWTDLRPRESAR